MSKFMAFIKKELLEMLPPTFFFLALFTFIAFLRSLISEEHTITVMTYSGAVVGALIMGKSILIADALPIANIFHNSRQIYTIIWRTLLYVFIAFCFQMLEEFIPLARKFGSLATASEHLVEEIDWARFWATHALLLVFLSFYNLISALIELVGADRFREFLFAPARPGSAID
jgi:hypothetical protein